MLLVEEGLESYGTVEEIGIVRQHTPAVDKHRICRVEMMLNQPFGHIRSHLDAVHDGLDVQ